LATNRPSDPWDLQCPTQLCPVIEVQSLGFSVGCRRCPSRQKRGRRGDCVAPLFAKARHLQSALVKAVDPPSSPAAASSGWSVGPGGRSATVQHNRCGGECCRSGCASDPRTHDAAAHPGRLGPGPLDSNEVGAVVQAMAMSIDATTQLWSRLADLVPVTTSPICVVVWIVAVDDTATFPFPGFNGLIGGKPLLLFRLPFQLASRGHHWPSPLGS
jgi:hypothetical protein